ncbi:MAG: hypothetical protein ABI639_14510 [Thermoanaerobaculia bacterium]
MPSPATITLRFDFSVELSALYAKRSDLDKVIAQLEGLSGSSATAEVTVDKKRGGVTRSTKKAAKPERQPREKPAKAARPKKGKPAAGELGDAEPVLRKGRMPVNGVQQVECTTLPERGAQIKELKSKGYRRCGLSEPLGPGLYDVRPSEAGADAVHIFWREPKEPAGE